MKLPENLIYNVEFVLFFDENNNLVRISDVQLSNRKLDNNVIGNYDFTYKYLSNSNEGLTYTSVTPLLHNQWSKDIIQNKADFKETIIQGDFISESRIRKFIKVIDGFASQIVNKENLPTQEIDVPGFNNGITSGISKLNEYSNVETDLYIYTRPGEKIIVLGSGRLNLDLSPQQTSLSDYYTDIDRDFTQLGQDIIIENPKFHNLCVVGIDPVSEDSEEYIWKQTQKILDNSTKEEAFPYSSIQSKGGDVFTNTLSNKDVDNLYSVSHIYSDNLETIKNNSIRDSIWTFYSDININSNAEVIEYPIDFNSAIPPITAPVGIFVKERDYKNYNPYKVYNSGDTALVGTTNFLCTKDNTRNDNPIISYNWVSI